MFVDQGVSASQVKTPLARTFTALAVNTPLARVLAVLRVKVPDARIFTAVAGVAGAVGVVVSGIGRSQVVRAGKLRPMRAISYPAQ